MNLQRGIKNAGTLGTIKTASSRHRPPLNPEALAVGKTSANDASPEAREAFTALLGTDNARPIEYMLIDHFHEAGQKKIQRISTLPYENNGKFEWDMVLVIGNDA